MIVAMVVILIVVLIVVLSLQYVYVFMELNGDQYKTKKQFFRFLIPFYPCYERIKIICNKIKELK